MKLAGLRRRCCAKSISAKDSPGSSPRPKPAKKASRSGIPRTRHSQASLHHGPPPRAACSLTACRPSILPGPRVEGVRTASPPPEPLPEPAEQTGSAVRRHLRQPLRRHPADGLVARELLAHVLEGLSRPGGVAETRVGEPPVIVRARDIDAAREPAHELLEAGERPLPVPVAKPADGVEVPAVRGQLRLRGAVDDRLEVGACAGAVASTEARHPRR